MVLCAAAALVLGIGSARFAALAGQGLGANLREAEYEKCSRIHLPISTISGYRRL